MSAEIDEIMGRTELETGESKDDPLSGALPELIDVNVKRPIQPNRGLQVGVNLNEDRLGQSLFRMLRDPSDEEFVAGLVGLIQVESHFQHEPHNLCSIRSPHQEVNILHGAKATLRIIAMGKVASLEEDHLKTGFVKSPENSPENLPMFLPNASGISVKVPQTLGDMVGQGFFKVEVSCPVKQQRPEAMVSH